MITCIHQVVRFRLLEILSYRFDIPSLQVITLIWRFDLDETLQVGLIDTEEIMPWSYLYAKKWIAICTSSQDFKIRDFHIIERTELEVS